ncbi:TIGR04222 domain-containing membrane protein [Streptomyces sp. ET3-23]|uniref:TIGR04222 domain-containing membrane protein n=1 Tax=Streptomyces sp. ET3-23 TaxID=2885643 RepID=UPI001D109239|nr:TIGR04222 domain-containing membrane protein [Streptomyces sp. ET3-23]MCC2278100.1 TIGR04222 domain-containing membrane protein [Streptomyces sp. ET3-23]
MIIAALVALLCLLVPSAWLVRLRWRARGAGFLEPEPSLVEAAYLRGGAGRVADAVITRMYDDERITVKNDKVMVVEPMTHNAVERALLKHCATWSRSLRTLRSAIRRDHALEAVHDSLVKQGLLLTAKTWRIWRRMVTVQRAGLFVAGFITLLLLLNPRSYPAPLILLPLVIAGIVVQVTCRPGKGWIPYTDRGRAVARDLVAKGPWRELDPAVHPEGLAGVVAVRGFTAMTDDGLRKQFEKAAEQSEAARRAARRRRASAYGSSSSVSSCSTVVVGASCDSGSGSGCGSGHGGGSGCSSSSSCSSSSCSSSSCSSSSCSSSSCS